MINANTSCHKFNKYQLRLIIEYVFWNQQKWKKIYTCRNKLKISLELKYQLANYIIAIIYSKQKHITEILIQHKH